MLNIDSSRMNGWFVCVLPYREALLVRRTRLLDVDIEVGDRPDDPHRLVHQPARVRIRDENVTLLHKRGDRLDSLDVIVRVASNLQLELAIPLFAIPGNVTRHLGRRALRDRTIELNLLAEPPPEQVADRLAARLAEEIPARHVDRGLHVRMTLQRTVHQLAGDERDSGSRPVGIRRQIHRAKRTDLTVPGQTLVGHDFDDRAVEYLDELASRPGVSPLLQREIDPIDVHARDLHRSTS